MNEADNEKTNPKRKLFRGLCYGLAAVIWMLALPWRLFTMPRRKRAAAAREAALREEQKTNERKEREAQLKREGEIVRKREALLTLEKRYDFLRGVARESGKPVDADALEKAWVKYESLLTDLGRTLPPRPYELKADQDLWQLIGEESEDTHQSLAFLVDGQDEVAQEASAVALIQLRREMQPPRTVDEHVKAVAELAARLRLLKTQFHANRNAEMLRLIERRARWRLYRKLHLATQRGRRAPRKPSLDM